VVVVVVVGAAVVVVVVVVEPEPIGLALVGTLKVVPLGYLATRVNLISSI
jgi:hypothetical protein